MLSMARCSSFYPMSTVFLSSLASGSASSFRVTIPVNCFMYSVINESTLGVVLLTVVASFE